MTEEKKRYWQNPDWNPLSANRRYHFKLSEKSDWQDILSTYDCICSDNKEKESK